MADVGVSGHLATMRQSALVVLCVATLTACGSGGGNPGGSNSGGNTCIGGAGCARPAKVYLSGCSIYGHAVGLADCENWSWVGNADIPSAYTVFAACTTCPETDELSCFNGQTTSCEPNP